MIILPAIDLKDGKVVMLTRGDYNLVSTYSDSPTEIAKQFAASGAKYLHIVDLDGARDGKISNFEAIADIIENTNLSVQVGGGIRDEERIKRYLEIGVDRVILGTVAAQNPDFVKEMVQKYGKSIAVGVDADGGKVAIKGWVEVTDIDSIEFCEKLEEIGVKTIIYTDISKDGMMAGSNLEIYEKLSKTLKCNLIASGGVSDKKEIEILNKFDVYGAIIGKGIYTGAINLNEVIELCK